MESKSAAPTRISIGLSSLEHRLAIIRFTSRLSNRAFTLQYPKIFDGGASGRLLIGGWRAVVDARFRCQVSTLGISGQNPAGAGLPLGGHPSTIAGHREVTSPDGGAGLVTLLGKGHVQ